MGVKCVSQKAAPETENGFFFIGTVSEFLDVLTNFHKWFSDGTRDTDYPTVDNMSGKNTE